ncbi:MAG TPA: 30S ribosomal protein S20 [Kiloniellales bacterium]|nr:30S ribosomal protein S20 [Kiloniellales bacterium]
MAHHHSAKKRIRRNARRAEFNRARLGRVRSFVKKVELAIAGGDKDGAQAALRLAEPELARGARARVIHRNAVARKVSRLSSRIKAMGQAQ